MKRLIGILVFSLIGIGASEDIQDPNHPELEWRTIETEHFYVHFHQGEDRTAEETARIAESIFKPVTELYGYVPDTKVHFIIRDYDDESNGGAYYYDNKVEIWASAMDFELRGTHGWLPNVVSHEYTHMISLGAARKTTRQIQAVFLQWFGYEKEKRPDVVHGGPNTLAFFPLAGTVIPPWFAEGMAQSQRADFDFDQWDSHRDMILRTAVLEGKTLSLSDMTHFEQNSLGRERVYNQGFALCLYIAKRHGEKTLSDLASAMRAPLALSFSHAIQRVLGQSDQDLYNEWMAWLRIEYDSRTSEIRRNLAEGRTVDSVGIGHFFPAYSIRGDLAYLSNQGHDYLSQTALRVVDSTGNEVKSITGVSTSFAWSGDGNRLLFAKKDEIARGSHVYDLYIYDLAAKKEKRLTKGLRLRSPDWSADGSIVAVNERDGTSNLVLVDENGKTKTITRFVNGEQIFSPRWIPQTGKIVFAVAGAGHGRDIAVTDSSGSGFDYILKTKHDERDPIAGADGMLYFASDSTGIYNLYRMPIQGGNPEQLTQTTGGAFMPALDAKGRLTYVQFKAEGFRIARIDSLYGIANPVIFASPCEKPDTSQPSFQLSSTGPKLEARRYQTRYSKMMFMPRIYMDYPGELKIGSYLSSSDILDKTSFFGGFGANRKLDIDAFGIFEFRKWTPTVFLEGYYQRLHVSDKEVPVVFDMAEIATGLDYRLSDNQKLRLEYVFSRYHATVTIDERLKLKMPYTYHIGSSLRARWNLEAVPRSLISDIAPNRGRRIEFEVEKAWQQYLDDFAVSPEYGTLIEVYSQYRYEQFRLNWREYLPALFKHHSLALRFSAAYIDQPIDDFYYLFGGNVDGMKGYPYYSIEGTRLLHVGAAYRFPLMQNVGWRILGQSVNTLFMSLYTETVNAWDKGGIDQNHWKRDVGVQLRLSTVSFYTYPLKWFFDAAYGLDRFNNQGQTYGRDWRLYFGILFEFLD